MVVRCRTGSFFILIWKKGMGVVVLGLQKRSSMSSIPPVGYFNSSGDAMPSYALLVRQGDFLLVCLIRPSSLGC